MPANTPLDAFVLQLPDIAQRPAGAETLSSMLAENSAHFAGLSVEETKWARAHIYAAMALSDDPLAGLEAAREDLATSDNPMVLAGVARLLRAAQVGPSWNEILMQARHRIEFDDIFPSFRFDPPLSSCCAQKTCLGEIDATLQRGNAPEPTTLPGTSCDAPDAQDPPSAALLEACLQDQSGHVFRVKEALNRNPILLALFYTRCMNPLKCSLTVARLGEVARKSPSLEVLGMSYDPTYDTPARLFAYGRDRRFPFSQSARLVRAQDGWDAIKDAVEMRAGYGAVTINAHAREVFLIPQVGGIWRLPPDWLTDATQITQFAQSLAGSDTNVGGHTRVG